MSANDLPMMPFFVKDWIAATMHWPSAERGAYISWLAFQWVNGCVPADVTQLARIAAVTEGDFDRIWLTVGGKFDAHDRGLFNKRLEEHRKEALRLRGARTLGATLANEKRRARRDAERDAGHGSTPVPRDDAERTHPSTSTSTSFEEKNKNAERKRSARAERRNAVSRETEKTDPDWLTFKLEMPLRAGGQPWEQGFKAWCRRRTENYTVVQMLDGAQRYKRYCVARGIERTEFVMQVKRFLGPEKFFLQEWEIPPEAEPAERWSPPLDETVDPP